MVPGSIPVWNQFFNKEEWVALRVSFCLSNANIIGIKVFLKSHSYLQQEQCEIIPSWLRKLEFFWIYWILWINHMDQIIRIKLSGSNCLNQIVWIKLAWSNWLDQIVWIKLSGSNYLDQIIWIKLLIKVFCKESNRISKYFARNQTLHQII